MHKSFLDVFRTSMVSIYIVYGILVDVQSCIQVSFLLYQFLQFYNTILPVLRIWQSRYIIVYIDGLVKDRINCIDSAWELVQSSTKPSLNY